MKPIYVLVIAAACGGSSTTKEPEPARTEPAEPAKPPEPAKTEPAKTEPAKTEPAKPGLITAIEPNTIVYLQSDDKKLKWSKDTEGKEATYVADDDHDPLYFASQPLTLGGKSYQLALWQFADDDKYIHGELLEGSAGGWKPAWVKRPIFDQSAGDLTDPNEGQVQNKLIKIGPDRMALMFTPGPLLGCGGEDCKPEDDFVPTELIEITPAGPVPVWRLDRGPGCNMEPVVAEDPEPQCSVSFVAGSTPDVFDMVVTTQVRKKKVTTRYTFTGGKYQPVKKK